MEMDSASSDTLNLQWKNYCMQMCRTKRDALIAETDYIHMPDVSVDSDKYNSLMTYRQELRDFPATFETLFDNMTEQERGGITDLSMPWPTKPE